MRIFILLFGIFINILISDTLDSLLKEYEDTSEKSLQTVDEKLGHVFIYSQKEIRLMQYDKLSDILKELPLMNLNKNRYGLMSPSLAGSKTTTSGFFRFFINDHEISSVHTQSASLTWGDLPLDFVDHIEIYYGESSFAQGNETGIYFIKIYTKSALKENSGEIKSIIGSKGSNSQSVTHSQSFENGWSYLLFLNKTKINETKNYNGDTLKNDGDRKYLYLDLSNEDTKINAGYTDIKKDNYMGLSFDVVPDSGQIDSKDYFVNISKYFLDDKSIKTTFSVDVNYRKYEEKNEGINEQGIAILPLLNFSAMPNIGPKEFSENLKLTKATAFVSKSMNYKNNNILAAFNVTNKKYEIKDRQTVNFLNTQTNLEGYNDFNEETSLSLLFQDDYKLNDNLIFIANAKVDKYKRNSTLEDSTEKLFRIGAIYTPIENFGLKSFYTNTYLPPSFYNMDFSDKSKPTIKTQKYKFYTAEGVFTTDKSKFSIIYHNVKIEDFIYLTPVGFINIDHTIKTDGIIFDYEYNFSNKNKIHLNYYITTLSETINNSSKGGYIKFMGEHEKFEYFTSLIYKNAYQYIDVNVKDSFDLNIGATYNFSKDLSFGIKGINLLNKSTKSLYTDGFPGTSFALEDSQRSVNFTVKWVF